MRRWHHESELLRQILVDCGLAEENKWGKPCFAHDGKNIAIIQKMKAFVALMFFKGALLDDPDGVLRPPGAHSNAARRLELRSQQEVLAAKATIERCVREAIAVEKAGLTVSKPARLELAPELRAALERDPTFKAAFDALTPGRQRGYNIYISAPKGSEARARRVEKYAPRIRAGKGIHDR